MEFLTQPDDFPGEAADTGSAVHAAVAAWHKNDRDAVKALDIMNGRKEEYPLADFDEAEKQFQAYTEDPRNALAEVVLCEYPLEVHMQAEEGEEIVLTGHVDQVRRTDRLLCWDLKTSKKEGVVLLDDHAYQIAGYCAGCTIALSQPVHPGGIIRTRGYRKRGVVPSTAPPGVFFESPYGLDECLAMIDSIPKIVADIRAGRVHPGPGDWCRYCPMHGIGTCVPELIKFRRTHGKESCSPEGNRSAAA